MDVLRYEEFTTWKPQPRHNNMFLCFVDGDFPGLKDFRKKEGFRGLEANFPELTSRLIETITDYNSRRDDDDFDFSQAIKDIESDLYFAYRLMRHYGSTDDEIFA